MSSKKKVFESIEENKTMDGKLTTMVQTEKYIALHQSLKYNKQRGRQTGSYLKAKNWLKHFNTFKGINAENITIAVIKKKVQCYQIVAVEVL